MKKQTKFIAFLTVTVVLLAIGAGCKVASAQSEGFEDSLVSPHTVMSVSINVARVYDSLKNKEFRTKFEKEIQEQHGVALSEVDQFQFFIGNPPKQKSADDTFNTKLTFREAKKFDAESVGKMSGYKLTEEKVGERVAFVGNPKREGSWGAMVISDRTLLFAVRRKMDALIESQKLKRPAEHKLDQLPKVDADLYLTLSGGDKTKEVFEEAWGKNYFSELIGMYQTGLVHLDTQSSTPLTIDLTTKDKDAAVKLKGKLEEAVETTTGHLKELESRIEAAGHATAILNSLEIKTDGAVLKILTRHKAVKKLPEF